MYLSSASALREPSGYFTNSLMEKKKKKVFTAAPLGGCKLVVVRGRAARGRHSAADNQS